MLVQSRRERRSVTEEDMHRETHKSVGLEQVIVHSLLFRCGNHTQKDLVKIF
jgi:hypothetical protein